MANFRSYNQGRPGMGNPYEGTGFTNLDNFLNQGNLDWGNAQSTEPGPMDLARGRTQPEAGFERWMYGATAAPQRNAVKEDTMPGAERGETPERASSVQPEMWTKDNSGWAFDRQKYEREFMKQSDTSPEAFQRWLDEKKNQYFEEFKQGQHNDTAGGSWNNGVKSIPGTQEKKFTNLEKFLGW